MKLTGKTLSIILPASALLLLASCGGEDPEPTPSSPEQSGEPAPPAPTSVIYQANPRFFGRSDCFEAIREELPRISGMGCDILWIMPHYLPGELKSVGSPYCIRDYKATNPDYGSLEDLRRLVDDAHGLGMKVIFDWVANHTSFDNVWTISNPERYRRDSSGNIAATANWSDVAQLDFTSPSTLEGMTDAMLYWIRECDIDGYRCDYAEGVPHDFWKALISGIRKEDPEFIMLAESSRTDFYADGFDMIYDWDFSPAMSATFKGGRPASLMEKSAATLSSIPEGKGLLRYAFNHDVAAENPLDTYFGDSAAIPAAYTLTCMLGGTPMIYSGMDVEGLRGKISFFNYNPLSFSSTLSEKFRLINAAYINTSDIRNGKLQDYSTREAICFTRTSADDTMLVVVNTTDTPISVKTPITLAGEQMTDMLNDNSTKIPVSIDLPAYGYSIYRN